MRHQNSVFHGLLKHLPWDEFDRLVSAHRADSRVRQLTTKSQLMALLYGQLARATSLRDIVTGFAEPCSAALPHRGPAAAALDAGRCQRQRRSHDPPLTFSGGRPLAATTGRLDGNRI